MPSKKNPATTKSETAQTAKVMGRPRKLFDWDEFDKLCAMQCTREEIMAFFEISDDTLNKRCKETHGLTFQALYDQKRQSGRTSLRRHMFLAAQKGNTTMQIFLSKQKQFLGFTDRLEEKVNLSGQLAVPTNMTDEQAEAQLRKMLERMQKRSGK